VREGRIVGAADFRLNLTFPPDFLDGTRVARDFAGLPNRVSGSCGEPTKPDAFGVRQGFHAGPERRP